MNDYKKARSIKEGILVNKQYLKYLKNYKVDKELEKKLEKKLITNKEYKYLDLLRERKSLKNCDDELELVKWEDIKSWNTKGRMGKISIYIQVKGLKHDLEPDFISNSNLIDSLEKYCFGKGKIDKSKSLVFASYYLYFVYFVILIVCLYMVINIFK